MVDEQVTRQVPHELEIALISELDALSMSKSRDKFLMNLIIPAIILWYLWESMSKSRDKFLMNLISDRGIGEFAALKSMSKSRDKFLMNYSRRLT